jgi:hypothetical protein
VVATELYDLQKDPQGSVNVAEAEAYARALPELNALFETRTKTTDKKLTEK